MTRKVVLALCCISIFFTGNAHEGMWLPTLIEKQKLPNMQAEGLQLSAEDIYSVNQACLKDAVILFSTGCTAEFISSQGLIITNHHCSDDYIQALSSLENNYLIDGFWSKNRQSEIPVPGLSVKVLEHMEDVSTQVLAGVDKNLSEKQRAQTIRFNTNRLIDSLSVNGKYHVKIRDIYHDNQFLAFISKEFTDVRLVGAPPLSIADFGGDTDNWLWPRHGADFALFRVYANQQNNPAPFNKNNVPYTPKKSLPISLAGVQPNDFTFVMGYPGSTDLYATSYKIKMLKEDVNPIRIGARTQKLDVLKDAMKQSDALELKYAAKAASISNSWKRWKGEIAGFNRFNVIENKVQWEQRMQHWMKSYDDGYNPSQNIWEEFKYAYEAYTEYYIPNLLITELTGKNGLETVGFADIFPVLVNTSDTSAAFNLKEFEPQIQNHFKNSDLETDKKMTFSLLNYYLQYVPYNYIPKDIASLTPNDSVALTRYVNKLFKKTHFADSSRLRQLMQLPPDKFNKQLTKDPAYRLNQQFSDIQENLLKPEVKSLNTKLDSLNRMYMHLILQFAKNQNLPPDANSGMRITYGTVGGYTPSDGVTYLYQTTIEGIMEKEDILDNDFLVNNRLKQLYEQKDFGNYGANGTLPLCFIASNHTTGGNSGSPVFNKNGELIGVNFDRAWDGVLSDYYYTPEICRNISVDIRYVLFIIDKFAGAKYLLNEMNIVK